MRLRAVPLALLLLAAGLTGCLTDDGDAELEAANEGPVHRVALATEPTTTASFEATFGPHEACLPGCMADEAPGPGSDVRLFDVTPLVPRGVATTIDVNVTEEDLGPVPVGTSFTLFVRTGTEVHGKTRASLADGQDHYRFELVRRTDNPVQLAIQYETAEVDDPDHRFQLDVTAQHDTTRVERGLPVRLPLDGGLDGVLVTNVGDVGAGFEATVHGPEGDRVGIFGGEGPASPLTLPEGAAPGTYTLVLHGPAEAYRLAPVDGEAHRLAPVAPQRETGSPHELGDDGAASWTFDVDRPLLQAAIRLTPGQNSWIEGGQATLQDSEMNLTLAGPRGVLIDREPEAQFSCVLCLEPESVTYETGMGPAGATAGSYEAHVEDVPGPGGTATEVVWTYAPAPGG